MSAVQQLTGTQVVVDSAGVVRSRSLKAPIAFAIVAVIGLLLAFPAGRAGESTYRLGDRTQSLQLPDVGLPTGGTVIACALILAVMAALTFVFAMQYKKIPLWFTVIFAVVGIFLFLTWSAAGGIV
ncbi:MAG: ABC transporter permease, partial [Leucobacter sp.]|nr:ABC transporter permease [Leucobacter sp.]